MSEGGIVSIGWKVGKGYKYTAQDEPATHLNRSGMPSLLSSPHLHVLGNLNGNGASLGDIVRSNGTITSGIRSNTIVLVLVLYNVVRLREQSDPNRDKNDPDKEKCCNYPGRGQNGLPRIQTLLLEWSVCEKGEGK